MVRENGDTRILSKTTSPLKPIRSQQKPYDESLDKMAQEKRDRIQRYKEERRKQMAARYGTIEPSSSDEENTNNNTSFRRRRRARMGLDSSSTDLSTVENRRLNENDSTGDVRNMKSKEVSSSEEKKRTKRISPFRTSTTGSSVDVRHQAESFGCLKSETLSDHSFNRSHNQEGRVDSADSTLSGSDGRGSRRKTSTEERDKSHKRKSHLNRASTSEEAVYLLPPSLSHLSDSSEDVPRRRRRRGPVGGCESAINSSSDLTSCRSSIPEKKSSVLLPTTLLSPLRSPSLLVSSQASANAGSQSAPSTLDIRSSNSFPSNNKEEFKSLKYNSLKTTPLKKPEIPDVLKSKESGLTSPGVLFPTTTDTRPSSVVIEKPPVAPEGIVRVPSGRLPLKKSTESGGTCFMATRREKKEEDINISVVKKESEVTSVAGHLDHLTDQALELTSRAQVLSEDSMVQECETYLTVNKDSLSSRSGIQTTMMMEAVTPVTGISLASSKGITSDTDQKNWFGGPEGNGEKVIRRLAFEEDMKHKIFPSDATVSSGPPNPFVYFSRSQKSIDDKESPPLIHSPSEPVHSILIRRSSRGEESVFNSSDKSGILKRKSSFPKLPSIDFTEGDPRPILKKRSSADEEFADPKSILKKKSLTDDELEFDRPKSILKSARSREENIDKVIISNPILKRYSRGDSEGEIGELRPILKRRDTSDAVHVHMSDAESIDTPPGRVRSDSAPDARVHGRSHSPSLPCAVPAHGILKRKSHTEQIEIESSSILRPRVSMNSEEHNRRDNSIISPERPLSVAERIAGMESMNENSVSSSPTSPISPGAKSRIRTSSEERTLSPHGAECPSKRDSYVSPSGEQQKETNEAFNPIFTPSKVSQKTAFFSKLEQEKVEQPKKDRGNRFSTQPVTEVEVTEASRISEPSKDRNFDKEPSNVIELGARSEKASSVGAKVAMWSQRLQQEQKEYWPSESQRRKAARFRTQPITFEEVLRASALNNTNSSQAKSLINGSTSITKRSSVDGYLVRRFSTHDLTDEKYAQGDIIKGILKNDNIRDRSNESPRSILKSDSRKSSLSENEHPKGILKAESPLTSALGSPDRETRKLRSALKKDSSFEDGKEIKSILKPESQRLDPEISSDSSSDVNQETEKTYIEPVSQSYATDNSYHSVVTSGDYAEFCRKSRSCVMKEAVKQAQPMRTKDNLAEALRQIEPIRRSKSRDSERKKFVEDNAKLFEETVLSRKEEVVIEEMKASFEENMKAISDLSQEERVTFRQRHSFNQKHQDRWTFNEFSSPLKSSRSSESSSSSSSSSSNSSPNAALPPTPPPAVKSSCHQERMDSPPTDDSEVGFFAHSPARSSINERLAALQRNGEEGWRNRHSKFDGEKEIESLSPKNGRSKSRPTSLLDRVSQLETSSHHWKGRVSQSDATKFTVAHKMASASSVPSLLAPGTEQPLSSVPYFLSPASERKKRSPLPKVFKSKTGSSIPDLINKKNKENSQNLAREFSRSISTSTSISQQESSSFTTVSIPQQDEDFFDDFFTTTRSSHFEDSSEVQVSVSDFDHISCNTEQLVIQRRNVKASRKNLSKGNPLKSLAAREDLMDNYIEVKLNAGEKELRRMKVEELSKSSSLALEALAGLASKENFSAVTLKKVEDNPVVGELSTFSDLMLLQVKGRRHPQVRLVEPIYGSVNSGDDFLLVTPSELFHYKGQYTNVIERAVASDMAIYILQTKDMGISNLLRITDVEENSTVAKRERFWTKLGGNSSTKAVPAGGPDDDDNYEAAIVASNKVFEVLADELSPVDQAWGQSPKYELLQSNKVLVFDFGSEVYFWGGKRASIQDKKRGINLLKELWEEEYDYSDCDINPIEPSFQCSMKGRRPKWGICGKITENVETILFKEKFVDWPDTAQQTIIKEVRMKVDQKADAMNELQPCDVTDMIESNPEEPDLVLEMSHLGRGVQYYDQEERRLHNITTNEFKVWQISESEKKLLPELSTTNFYSNETYVVRWFYHVTATGRTLKGAPSKHNVLGRYRIAYFFWQGRSSSISDKGVSALMTVELDQERGPHVRVSMGHEPPAFLNLFEGKFIIHEGQRSGHKIQWRMFVLRGSTVNEGHLMQVDVSANHLRSKGCLLLINTLSGIVFLWTGSRSSSTTKSIALNAANLLLDNRSEEVGWKTSKVILREEQEGAESNDFLNGVGLHRSPKTLPFNSLLSSNSYSDTSPRFWRFQASHDSFLPIEVVSSYRLCNIQSPFPVWQEELYTASQPALFMIDAGYKVFAWQGWWPDEVVDQEESSTTTGSAFLRFLFSRRALLKTVLEYVKVRSVKSNLKEDPEIVIAGMETLEFTNLFPFWKTHSEVVAAQEKEGRWQNGTKYLVEDVFKQLCRDRYSLEELQARPLPDGVDPSRLENYLSDQEFQLTLGIDRESFRNQAGWKRLQLKKNAKLF